MIVLKVVSRNVAKLHFWRTMNATPDFVLSTAPPLLDAMACYGITAPLPPSFIAALLSPYLICRNLRWGVLCTCTFHQLQVPASCSPSCSSAPAAPSCLGVRFPRTANGCLPNTAVPCAYLRRRSMSVFRWTISTPLLGMAQWGAGAEWPVHMLRPSGHMTECHTGRGSNGPALTREATI